MPRFCCILFIIFSYSSLFSENTSTKTSGFSNSFSYNSINYLKKDSLKTFSPFVKSLLEISSVYSVRTAIYTQTGALQDNDYSSWREGFSERFNSKKPYRLDDNSLFINHVGHAFLPAVETGLFRSNGMNFYNSFLLQLSASTIWEFVIEAKETVSLNDMVMTPIAGSSISEVAFQFSQFFRKSKGTIHNKLVGGLFTGTMAFNYWINNNKRNISNNIDKNGFDANTYHLFKSSVGVGQSFKGNSFISDFGTEMEIIKIKEYGYSIGEDKNYFTQPFLATFNMNLISGLKEIGEFNLSLHTMFNGYYSKNIRMDSSQIIKGNSFLIGTVTGYEINYSQFPDYNDNLIHLHVLGSEMQWISHFKGMMIKSKTILFGDMSSVTSQLLNDYSVTIGGLDSAKNTLKKESYYNALGFSFSSELEVRKGRFSIGGKFSYGQYSSIENLDRHQETVVHDFHLDDIRVREKLWGSYNPYSGIEFQVGYESRSWKSKIEDMESYLKKDWLYCKLILLY